MNLFDASFCCFSLMLFCGFANIFLIFGCRLLKFCIFAVELILAFSENVGVSELIDKLYHNEKLKI